MQLPQAGRKEGSIMSTQTTTLQGGASITAQEAEQNTLDYNVGVYFDIIQEHSVSIQNQITDNYIENNTAIQDHIAKLPLVISLRGLSGELVYKPPTKALDFLYNTANTFLQSKYTDERVATDKLTAIPALLPPVDNVTQMAKNAVQYVEASVNRYVKIVKNFISSLDRETKLQEKYNRFIRLRESDNLLRVETPYKTLDNMVIQSLTLRQGDLNYVTDIELTLKQINYATTYTTKPNESVMAKYNAMQRTEEANHGKAQGVDTDNSVLYNRFGGGAEYLNYNR